MTSAQTVVDLTHQENVPPSPASSSSPPVSKLPPLHPFHEALAGGISAALSRFLIAPLDVLKIRFQIQEHPTHTITTTAQQSLAGAIKCSHSSSTSSFLSNTTQPQYRSLLQSIGTIYREEGIRAFWKGNFAAELMVVPYGAVSFAAYQWSKHQLEHLYQYTTQPFLHKHRTTINHLISGSFTGCMSTISTYPLDLLRTRFACQQKRRIYTSLRHAAFTIYSNEGVAGFYVGMWPTLVGIVPFMAVQFASYESLKKYLRKWHKKKRAERLKQLNQQNNSQHQSLRQEQRSLIELPSLDNNQVLRIVHPNNNMAQHVNFHTVADVAQNSLSVAMASVPIELSMAEQSACGCIAGCLAKIVTMPMEVIKRRYQVANFNWEASRLQQLTKLNDSRANYTASASNSAGSHTSVPLQRRAFKGVWDCAKGIVQHEGVRGLFKGSQASLLKAGPNSALIYVSYEQSRKLLRKLETNKETDKNNIKLPKQM